MYIFYVLKLEGFPNVHSTLVISRLMMYFKQYQMCILAIFNLLFGNIILLSNLKVHPPCNVTRGWVYRINTITNAIKYEKLKGIHQALFAFPFWVLNTFSNSNWTYFYQNVFLASQLLLFLNIKWHCSNGFFFKVITKCSNILRAMLWCKADIDKRWKH